MNNEPVAWMSKEDFEDYLSEDKKVTSATVFNFKLDIPLYTCPVKELTDEEIDYEFDEFCWVGNRRADFELIVRQVEKAILRKAQKK